MQGIKALLSHFRQIAAQKITKLIHQIIELGVIQDGLVNPAADKYEIIPAGAYQEAYACLLPKGDTAFKTLVDDVLAGMMQNGEMEALYKKWFNQPIQPFGKSLNMTMNEATQALYKEPNDRPSE